MTVAIKGIRWWMIGLLMLGAIINYLTRSTLSVAAPTVMADLHISTQQYSCGVGMQSKLGTTTGILESNVALRLGKPLDSNGKVRRAVF